METRVVHWPSTLQCNLPILSEYELEIAELLISIGQSHLFDEWDEPGKNDKEKHDFFDQIIKLHKSYPSPGGLRDYITNARRLLASSKNGDNPLADYIPELPSGVLLEPLSPQFLEFEDLGKKEIGFVGFVLVAGGLGERLGYSGIKVELPSETTTWTCYLELYCQSILSIQNSHGNGKQLPFAIMTSDDTHSRTLELLESHGYFGLSSSQIVVLKQEKVAAMSDIDGHIARSSTYIIETKPHGHGDVHSLMYSSGTARKWLSNGIRWVYFFQDTNGLAFLPLAAQLGVSVALNLEVNSMAIPRVAKQAIGAIAKLVKISDRSSVTVNVEYNQLDPLLRATVNCNGDVNDTYTGQSPFPGNINQLLFLLAPYEANLTTRHGVLAEFVNPKYLDSQRTTFKKPTRLECMMQDYPLTLGSSARVGYTQAPAWFCYSPCKNNVVDAALAVGSGIPAMSAFTAESDQYNVFAELLRKIGVNVAKAELITVLGIKGLPGPQIVIKPSAGVFVSDFMHIFPHPSKVHVSKDSTLVISGDVVIEELRLNGFLSISSSTGQKIIVKVADADIANEGMKLILLEKGEFREVDRMRGFMLRKVQEYVVSTATPVSLDPKVRFFSPRSGERKNSYIFDGRDLFEEG